MNASEPDSTPDRFDHNRIHDLITTILQAWGMPAGSADLTAEVMVDTDLSGIDSHGISMLMMYESLHRKGRLDLTAQPTVLREGAAFAVLDAHHGLGHPVAVEAIDRAARLAATAGVGMVTVRNSHHFGAGGYYVRRAAAAGLAAIVTSTTRSPVVAATGSHLPVLGTNPLAFAAPRRDGEPVVVDMSTSTVAMNKVKSYGLQRNPLPTGWVTDRSGRPLTDATEAFDKLLVKEAVLSPLGGPGTTGGGHKGFGLSMMVQILSAALSNAAAPGHDGDHDNIGHFFLAIDPELVNPGQEMHRNVDELVDSVRAPGVMIPGEPEAATRKHRLAEGIPLPHTLMTQIAAICERAGVEFDAASLLIGNQEVPA